MGTQVAGVTGIARFPEVEEFPGVMTRLGLADDGTRGGSEGCACLGRAAGHVVMSASLENARKRHQDRPLCGSGPGQVCSSSAQGADNAQPGGNG